MRQIVLDTETTGLEPHRGDKIIEVGAVEIIHGKPTGRTMQHYLDPQTDIVPEATDVHGITREQLADCKRFENIAMPLLNWLRGAELVIHNAPFDISFLDAEFSEVFNDWTTITDHCNLICTRELAQRLLPGIKPSLDHLCDYYGIDRSHRTHHGALIDAQLLTQVYTAMINNAEVPA